MRYMNPKFENIGFRMVDNNLIEASISTQQIARASSVIMTPTRISLFGALI
jgi:hypothetical protein